MKETKFFRVCLSTFTSPRAKGNQKALIACARKLGAGDNDQATQLFVKAELWLLRSLAARPIASLTSVKQAAFMVWLSGILFNKRPLERADFLYGWGTFCLAKNESHHYAIRGLLCAFSIRRRECRDWSPVVDTLLQLAIAFDETGKRCRATRVLELAYRLCDVHQVEPGTTDLCMRLSAAAQAWNGELDTALKRMDQAAALNASVDGATPLQAAISWTIAICQHAFHAENAPYSLRTAMLVAFNDVLENRDPTERFVDIDGLVHALSRTSYINLAILSTHTTIWLAREAPAFVSTAYDRGILFNNYGNALLSAGLYERSFAAFEETIRSAGGNWDADQQADADYQCIHAYGGMGFVHFNLGNHADTPAEQQTAFHEAAFWFAKAAQLCKQIGSRAWFEGRAWACAGLVESNLGRPEQAWFYFAWALLAGFSNWGAKSDPATLEGFLNPDSYIRLKMVEGFEQLNARHAAVLFGKAAVHAVYREAFPSEALDSAGSAMYLRSRSGTHRKLAQSLTIAGRYNEAEQAFALLKDDAWGVYTRREGVPVEIEAAVAVNIAEAAGINRSGIPSFLASIPQRESISDSTIARMGDLLAGLDHALETEIRLRKARQIEAQGSVSIRTLVPGDARIRYLVSPTYMTITVQVGDSITTHRISTSFEEISLMTFALRQSHSRSQSDFLAMSFALHGVLIGPVAEALKGVTHLWVETDSPLDGVPFATLFDGKRYVFECYSIAYLNAAGNGKSTNAAQIASSVTVFACSELSGARLPGAALEREVIQEALKPKTPPKAFAGYSHDECTIERMLDNLGLVGQSNSAIHLATHAAFNATSDALSILALADGNLSMSRLRKAVERNTSDLGLFVLSACGTARQDLDVEGFSLTLLRGGVRSVISSLWETLDVSAPAFFKAFYEACVTFESPRAIAVALQLAQISLSQHYRDNVVDAELSQAAHWAPYIVMTGRIG